MVQLRSGTSTRQAAPELHVITGGGGYVGTHLGRTLVERGHRVLLFDIHTPAGDLKNMDFIQGDICLESDVVSALVNADCVYHVASYGMSGREQLNKDKIQQVNIQGTQNVLTACTENNIERLVYTSTYNVVFGGQVIENGDEALPYFPVDKHPDSYSPTKAVAEHMVLQSNGTKLSNGRTLQTCALRLAGVYGPGEQRHLPRVVGYIEKGLFSVTYGANNNLVDFLHIDNLVQGHVLAGEALSEHKQAIAAGQKYFLSDGKPVNNFEFFRPLVEGLGYSYPRIHLPIQLIYYIAFLIEWLHFFLGRVYNFQPLLTRTEVFKTGVTHYFSIVKAQTELGYKPTKQNDMTEALQHFKNEGRGKFKKTKQSRFMRCLVDVCLAIIFAVVLMSFLPVIK